MIDSTRSARAVLRHRLGLTAATVLATALLSACSGPQGSGEHGGRAGDKPRQELAAGLVVGDYDLADDAVVDGDTLRVVGLDATLRLLGIDTEETFKKEEERRAYAAGWESYLKSCRKDSPRPVKMATPMGDEAKAWAKEFFHGVRKVHLERDHEQEVRDRYGRILAYVFIDRDGKRLNYNVEAVRAGMAPYFSKYGYSRRFHEEFVKAQAEARAAGVGIWDPAKQHYPDYDERLVWWEQRAQFVQKFWASEATSDHHVVLTQANAWTRLEALVGREAVVLGGVSKVVEPRGGGPMLVELTTGEKRDFKLVIFEKSVADAAHIADFRGELVTARGEVSRYKHPRTGEEEVQIIIRNPEQVQGSVTAPAPVAATAAPAGAGEAAEGD